MQLEKQVSEVEQFYNPTDGVQVNHYKGRGMHLSGTKKPILQGGSSREVLGMQELMHRFATILDEVHASTLQLFLVFKMHLRLRCVIAG